MHAVAANDSFFVVFAILIAFAAGLGCGGILMFFFMSREESHHEPLRDYFETDGML